MKIRYLLGLAALVAAVPASAQRPDSSMRGKMMMRGGRMDPAHMKMMAGMMGGMMPAGKYSPERLLAKNGELKLTARQISDLTALRDATHSTDSSLMASAKMHHDELKEVMDAGGTDTAAIKKHFLAAHDAMGQAMLTRILAGAKARAILTDAQRKQVEAWPAPGMGGRGWQGRGPGAGPNGPGTWRRSPPPPPAGAPQKQ